MGVVLAEELAAERGGVRSQEGSGDRVDVMDEGFLACAQGRSEEVRQHGSYLTPQSLTRAR